MDLGNSVFEYGQTYVALSRIRNLGGLYLSAFQPKRIKANPIVKEFYDRIPVIKDSPILHKNIFSDFSCPQDHSEVITPVLNKNIRIIKL